VRREGSGITTYPGAAVNAPGKVTVVIPVWDDYVSYLSDAVESVRRNSPDAPIVIVDNASRTEVPELEGCTIVSTERRLSAGAARNVGLQHVDTELVLFLDADDMLLDGTLGFMRSRIDADPAMSISATAILDGETGERHRSPRRFVARLAQRPRLFAVADSVWSLLPLQGCAVMRTSQVRESGGYADANLGEDWVLAVALAFQGRVDLSDRLGRLYRPTPGSLLRSAGRTPREFAESAGRVRERLRSDPGVPRWARALLPLIALFQLGAIYVARPAYLGVRSLIRR